MAYLVTQIWLFLLLAGLIGSVIGWVLRGSCKRRMREFEQSWKDLQLKLNNAQEQLLQQDERLFETSEERNRLRLRLNRLEQRGLDTKKVLSQSQKLKKGIKTIGDIHQETSKTLERNLKLLSFAKQSIKAKDEQLSSLNKQLAKQSAELKRTRAEVENYNAELQEKTKEMQMHHDSSERLHELHVQQVETEAELASVSKQLSQISSHNEELKVKLQGVQQQLSSEQNDKKQLIGNLQNTKEQLAAVSKQLNTFKAQGEKYIVAVTKENEQKQNQLNATQEQLQGLKLQLGEKDKELNDLRDQLAVRVDPGVKEEKAVELDTDGVVSAEDEGGRNSSVDDGRAADAFDEVQVDAPSQAARPQAPDPLAAGSESAEAALSEAETFSGEVKSGPASGVDKTARLPENGDGQKSNVSKLSGRLSLGWRKAKQLGKRRQR